MEIVSSRKTALVLGSTGLVGNHLLERLLVHPAYGKVVAPTRRSLHRNESKLENPIIDFDRMDRDTSLFRCQDIFIALGTTIAKAGSQENFRRVDYDYIVGSAALAKSQGANQCLLVSSAGADANSRFFYNRVKGETERAIERLDFWATHIFRPGVLLGDREESRLGERVAATVSNFIRKLSPTILGDYNPTPADELARQMIDAAQGIQPGLEVHSALEMVRIAE